MDLDVLRSPRTLTASIQRRAFVVALGAVALALACTRKLSVRGPGAIGNGIAPEFVLRDHRGATVSLAELLASGPAILVFYRGHW